MSTRTMPATHEERCRELAESKAIAWDGMTFREYERNGYPLDPRFASLRGDEHRWSDEGDCWSCDARVWDSDYGPYCLRTDIDSLIKAAAACGSTTLAEVLYSIQQVFWWPADENFQLRQRKEPSKAASEKLWRMVFD